MSQTISTSTSRRTQKSTCRRCNRTVIVVEVDGQKVEADPELLNVVPIDGAPAFVMARRAHADLCDTYQREAEKAKLREEQRKWKEKRERKKWAGRPNK